MRFIFPTLLILLSVPSFCQHTNLIPSLLFTDSLWLFGRFPIDAGIIQKKSIKKCEHFISDKKSKGFKPSSITYFNAAGKIAEQMIYSSPAKKSDTASVIYNDILLYDEQKRIVKENITSLIPDTSYLVNEIVTLYSTDSAYVSGKLISIKDTAYYGSARIAYNADSQILSYEYYDSLQRKIARSDYIYDSIGRTSLVNVVYYNFDTATQNKKLTVVYTYSNKDGYLKQKVSQLKNGNVLNTTHYYYDANGKCHHSVTLQNRKETREYYYYNADGLIISREYIGLFGRRKYHTYYYY